METIKKVFLAIAIIAGVALLVVDACYGQAECGDEQFNQTTGMCVSK